MNNRNIKTVALIALASLLSVNAAAQTSSEYAKLEKSATFNYDTQQGEITLESYVTGMSKVTQEAKPIDVVLVLDYSSSMGNSYSVDSTYSKVVADVRYAGSNIKSGTSSSKTNWQNDTQSRIGEQLFDSNGNAITKSYGGKTYNVYGIHIVKTGYTPSQSEQTTNDFRNWAYITVDGTRYFLRLDGSLMKEKGNTTVTYTTWPTGEDGDKIYPAHLNERTIFSSLKEITTHTTTRAAALQFAAGKFIEQIAEHARTSNVTNRIAVVSFQTGATTDYPNIFGDSSGYTDSSSDSYLREFPSDKKASGAVDGSLEGRTMVAKRFVDTSSEDAVKILKYAISDIGNKGNTPVHLGVDLANKLIAKFGRTDSNVAKFVILFSDGEPTQTDGNVWNTNQGADKAVANAYHLKHDLGWNFYSVYCNSQALSTTSNTYNFLDYCSSNYPNATAYNSGDHTKATSDINFFKTATDNLATVFENLTSEITSMAGVQYGTETLLKDFVNNTYFKMPDDIVQSDVKVYEQACTSVTGTSPNIVYGFDNLCIDEGTGANRCWHEGATEAAAQTSTKPKLKITIERADPNVAGSQDRVLISGYDYSCDANWCGIHKTTSNPTGYVGGHRLVIKFPFVIKVQSGTQVTGSLETNGEDSGIYEAKEDSSGRKPGESGYVPTYESEPATKYPMPVIYFASLIIGRTDLDEGESAIYDIYQTLAGSSTETKVGRLSINGSGSKNDSKIMYGLAGGVGVKYRVVETNWNWAYHTGTTLPESEQTIQAKSSTETTVPATSNLNFNFTGVHVTPSASEEPTSPYSMYNHDEEYKVNILEIPTTTTP